MEEKTDHVRKKTNLKERKGNVGNGIKAVFKCIILIFLTSNLIRFLFAERYFHYFRFFAFRIRET